MAAPIKIAHLHAHETHHAQSRCTLLRLHYELPLEGGGGGPPGGDGECLSAEEGGRVRVEGADVHGRKLRWRQHPGPDRVHCLRRVIGVHIRALSWRASVQST